MNAALLHNCYKPALRALDYGESVYQRDHRIAVYRSPAAVISPVMRIYLFVIPMFLRHMTAIGNIQWEIPVGSWMLTDQTVVLVADADLCHSCFENCRFSQISIQY